jgi:NAD(P)H-dependent FMN reductase
MPTLQIIIASVREGRAGLRIGQWIAARAEAHGGFDIDVVDLGLLGLPFMDEPNHPRLHRYTRQHTKDWSARVQHADAFVFVTPEYNHGMSAPLKNAIDYLHVEWQHKPVGFVSYGGVAAGTRAVEQTKQVVTALRMVPVAEAVTIPFFQQFLDDDGAVRANAPMEEGATAMLDALARAEEALRPLRAAVAGAV